MSMKFGSSNPLASSGVVDVLDDVLFILGDDADNVLLNRSTSLAANTALTDVLIGTPVTPAIAANSFILSNITTDGDILFAGSDGGNSLAFMFFDASTPDLYLYKVGGTWTAGATTWEIPAVTLNGDLTTNAKDFDMGGASLTFKTTGGDAGIVIEGSASGGSGPKLETYHNSASPADNDEIVAIRFKAKNSTAETIAYSELQPISADVTNGTEDGSLYWWNMNAGTRNNTMRLLGTGVLSVDLAGTGTDAQVDLFDDYDDAIEIRETIQQKNRDRLVDLGCAEYSKTGSGYMLNVQPMFKLYGGAIYQTRALLEELAKRVGVDMSDLLETALALPEGGNNANRN